MGKHSAGILMYRKKGDRLEVLLVHPGGPFFARKDLGAWSIPKGEFEGEDALHAAKREFYEETGQTLQDQELIPLAPQKQKGGKTVYAWALEGDIAPEQIKSNLFEMEWPPRSGRKQQFPEIDRAEWFPIEVALQKINPGQVGFIQELVKKVGGE